MIDQDREAKAREKAKKLIARVRGSLGVYTEEILLEVVAMRAAQQARASVEVELATARRLATNSPDVIAEAREKAREFASERWTWRR